jgi:hypothetical protein
MIAAGERESVRRINAPRIWQIITMAGQHGDP